MTQSPQKNEQKIRISRRFIYLVGIASLFGLSLAILLVFLLRGTSDTSATAPPTQPDTPTPIIGVENRSVSPQPAPTDVFTETQVDSSGEVVLVNEQVIDMKAARIMQASDQTMAQLLGQPPPTGTELLERLINGELVMQAASDTDFTMSDDDLYGMLDALLTEQDLTQRALNDALAEQGISLSEFRTYFARLAFIAAFSRAQAAEQDIQVSTYIDQLQSSARISYGPAATTLILEAAEKAEEAKAVGVDATSADAATKSTPAMSSAQGLSTAEPFPTPPTPQSDAEAIPGSIDADTAPDQLAPDFSLSALSNPTSDVLSRADLLGQPTVLSFWTTWCPYCRRQTPVLVDAYQQYAGDGIRFVGINVKEDQGVVEKYLTENGVDYPIALDADGQVASDYNVRGFPTTIFLDAEGRIVARHVGALDEAQLSRQILQLLAPG